jgi:biotin transport system substrate-specific component
MKTKDIVLTALFVALMIVSAFIRIKLPFVSITFQLITAIASGIFLGPKYGPLSQVIYLLLGLIGLPFFAEGGGFTYIFKTSFGYLLSFPLTSFVAAGLWKNSLFSKASSIFFGILTSYAIGVPYLWYIINYTTDQRMSLTSAINAGFTPFILKDIALGIVLFLVALPVTKYLESKETETANS